jgi:hypothetical protein
MKSWRRPLIALWAASLTAGFLGGCALVPRLVGLEVLASWVQLGPDVVQQVRAIVPAGTACPPLTVDGATLAMRLRARANARSVPFAKNPAFDPPFPVDSCELDIPPAAVHVQLHGRELPLARSAPKRILIVGDTGCRIKRPAKGAGDPLQDCTDPAAWPWPRLAAAAARHQPDLTVHLGDYHYRELCDDSEQCPPLRAKGVTIGYGWEGWDADFFGPAAPLLATTPWVFVRGNHENCDRAGEGWMRFLAPTAYRPCADQRYKSATRSLLATNQTADAYRIDLDEVLSLLLVDNAGHEDYRPATKTPTDAEIFARTLQPLQDQPAQRRYWFLSHRPIWYPLLGDTDQPNAFQVALQSRMPAGVELALAGHQHGFTTLNFAPAADPYYPQGRPPQLIVGNGGTQLEAYDPQSPLYEGAQPGSKEWQTPTAQRFDGLAAATSLNRNRYGYLVLERTAEAWQATVYGDNEAILAHCRLAPSEKAFHCRASPP